MQGGRKRQKSNFALIQELALESKKLNDILISNKLTFEEELRDVKNRAREEEIRKNQAATKAFEQRLKVLE